METLDNYVINKEEHFLDKIYELHFYSYINTIFLKSGINIYKSSFF